MSGWVAARLVFVAVLQVVYFAALIRILPASDFGEVAIAMVVLMAVDVLSQTGVDLAILRQRGDILQYLDAAWSLSVVRGLALAVIVLAIAGGVSLFYDSSRVAGLIAAAALVPVIDGLQSKSVVLLGRDLRQRELSIAETSATVVSMLSGIWLALWLESPWAVVWNMVLFSAFRTLGTFVVHPHRPGFTLQWGCLRPFLRYGVFFNLSGVVQQALVSIDRLFIARLLGLAPLGLYDRCFTLSSYLVNQAHRFLSATVYPGLAAVQEDPARLRRLTRFYVTAAAALYGGGSVILFLGSEVIVHRFIGEVFLASVPEYRASALWMFRVLIISVAFRGSMLAFQILFDLHNRVHLRFVTSLVQLAVLGVALPIGCIHGGLRGAAVAVALSAACGQFLTIVFLSRLLNELHRAERSKNSAGSTLPEDDVSADDNEAASVGASGLARALGTSR